MEKLTVISDHSYGFILGRVGGQPALIFQVPDASFKTDLSLSQLLYYISNSHQKGLFIYFFG